MITLADVRRQQNPALQMALTLAMWSSSKPAYEEWVALVESAIARAMDALAERRHHFQQLGEDALTQAVCMALQGGGLPARSAVVNGNCDLTVEFYDFGWIGEAKIADDVNKIYGGYLQLTERYAKGTIGYTSLGMLLYCIDSQALASIAGWRAALAEQVADSNPRECDPPNPLQFRSHDICSSTGIQINIFHIAAAMKFDPKEKNKKLSPEARVKARTAKSEAKS